MTRVLVGATVLTGLVITPTLRAGDTLEDVEKKIISKWSNVRSVKAKMDMKMNMRAPKPIQTKGTFEYLRDGDTERKRMHFLMENNVSGQTIKMAQTVIHDGEFAWTISEIMGQTRIVKQRPTVMEGTPGGASTFKTLEETYALVLLQDDKVDGRATYVIAGKPKATDKPGVTMYKMYYAKDDGMLLKVIGLDENDDTVMIITYRDVKFNEKLDPERFVFRNPGNVQVLDMTRTTEKPEQ